MEREEKKGKKGKSVLISFRWASEKYDGIRMLWNPNKNALYPLIVIVLII